MPLVSGKGTYSMGNRIVGGCVVALGIVCGLVDWFFPRIPWVILTGGTTVLSPKSAFLVFVGVMCFSAALVGIGGVLLRCHRDC